MRRIRLPALLGAIVLSWTFGDVALARENYKDHVLSFLNTYRESHSQELRDQIAKFHHEIYSDSHMVRLNAAIELGIHYNETNALLANQYFAVALRAMPEDLGTEATAAIDFVIHFYHVKAQMSSRKYKDALASIESILRSRADLDSRITIQLWEMKFAALNAVATESDYLTAFESFSKKYGYRQTYDPVYLQAAAYYRSTGHANAYKNTLEKVARFYPTTAAAKEAFDQLMALAKDGEYKFQFSFLKKMNLYQSMDKDISVKLHEIIDADYFEFQGEALNRSEFRKGLAYYYLRDYATALDNLKDHDLGALSTGERRRIEQILASTHSNLGNFAQADEYYKSLAQTNQGSSFYDSYGRHLFRSLKYEEAAASFAKAATLSSERHLRWLHFWSVFQARKYEEALALLDRGRYVQSIDPSFPKGTEYWRATVLKLMGRESEAKDIFAGIVADDPYSYYGSLIIAKYPELGSASNPIFGQEFDTSPQQLIAANQPLSDILTLTQPYLMALSTKAEEQSETKLENLQYPLAYGEIIEPLAADLDVDKYLVYSIIKAESNFKPRAYSHVGARGLMQIMPYTGLRIAEILADDAFEIEALNDHNVNLAYGIFYFKKLLTHFGNSPFLALAAYNAGPEAVKDWMKSCMNCSGDQFVESISFLETRQYVKKVISNYRQYRRIYENPDRFTVLPVELPKEFADTKIF
jgi:hypothetical protein